VSRVLVTGAGGAAGISVVRALGSAGHHVVAADPDALAAGLFLADDRVLLPLAHDAEFPPAVVATAMAHHVDAVITTVAEEVAPLAGVVDQLTRAGAAIWLSPTAAVRTCIDKWAFARAAEDANLPVPPTADAMTEASLPATVPGPWVVKPRFGRGSRDVSLVDDPDELAWAVRRTPDAIVQTRCGGREFTVDALVDRDGSVPGIVPRWRLETKAGISTKGTTFSDLRIDALVRSTVGALGLRGAINLQGFVDESDPEPVRLLEVNPRFSGGLALSLASGADLVGEFLRGTLGMALRPERLVHADGVTMTRHYAEVFVTDQGAPL
jgi:carbamoyl-phosphate synthase large subunit